MPEVAAIVLCGGESRRMGSPKADLPFGEESLLCRAVRHVGSVASTVVVAAAPGQVLPALPTHVLIARDRIAALGPIEGLVSALSRVPAGASLVQVVPVDSPCATAEWLRAFAARIGEAEALVPVVGGLPNPLLACYRPAPLRAAVEALQARGERRVRCLLNELRWRAVEEEDLRSLPAGLEALRNLNTPEEYRRAARDAARRDPRLAEEDGPASWIQGDEFSR